MRRIKNFFLLITISLLFSVKAYADNHLILIQCKDDRPELAFLQPIYEINLETKKVKVGYAEMVVARNTTETELILVKSNPVMAEILTINRNTGKYISKKRFFSSTGNKEDEKKITETGICVKIEKAF
jgi:hypothetical protein